MITFKDNQLYISRGAQKTVLSPDTRPSEEEAKELFVFMKTHHNLFDKNADTMPLEHFPFSPPRGDKIILFPGSFSPWHEGHEACVRNLPKGSQVVIMPDHNPWKEIREGSLWCEASDIWQALLTMKGECSEIKMSLYLGFLGLKQKNPTITWLRKVAFKEKWLLMGEDTFLNLHKWTHGDEVLLELDGLYVCPRAKPQEKVLEQKDFLINEYNSQLKVEFLAPHEYQHYSSTWLREKAKKA